MAPIRFAIAAVCAAAARAAGLSTSVVLVAFALGCFGCAAVVLSDRRGLILGAPQHVPVPDDALFASRLAAALSACFPSTAGLAVLSLVALVADAKLAALLAGGVPGLGIAGLVSGVQVAQLERRQGLEYFVAAKSRLIYEQGCATRLTNGGVSVVRRSPGRNHCFTTAAGADASPRAPRRSRDVLRRDR